MSICRVPIEENDTVHMYSLSLGSQGAHFL